MGFRSQFIILLVKYVRRVFEKVWGFLFNHKYHLDDILMIIRPFIYVYSIMKCGRKSYTPIKISLAMDLISIIVSLNRLIKASKTNRPATVIQPQQIDQHYQQVSGPDSGGASNAQGAIVVKSSGRLRSIEKNQLMKRIWGSLIMYLIRYPIFEDYTYPVALKIFTTLHISPRILGLLLSIVSFYRYYAYIA